MACFHPVHGYRSRTVNNSGKRSIVFDSTKGYADLPVTVPCGRCAGCRLERSRQWAIRCVHEAQLHKDNCFITLTYNDSHLPKGGTLVKKHYQDFMKKLRHYIYPQRVRYYQCGEYGDENHRPHYHACLFGLDFSDKIYYTTRHGNKLYISPTLDKLWTDKQGESIGFASIGAVTFESAAYVARYIMKKVNGARADEHYNSLDPDTGEIIKIIPEYTTMSRRPGIGMDWYLKYKDDIYPEDFVVINGRKMRPARYYDSIYEIDSQKEYKKLKEKRRQKAAVHYNDNTPERLAVREKVLESKTKQLKRTV